MPDLIQLKNTRRRPFSGTLFHDSYCRKGGTCGCRQEPFLSAVRNNKTGVVGLKTGRRQKPVGIWIAPGGGLSPPLTRAVLKVPGFSRAVAEGWLVAVPVVPAKVLPMRRRAPAGSTPAASEPRRGSRKSQAPEST